MAGRKKTVVESTEQEISTKQEVSTDIEDIAVDEAIAELKRINALDKKSSFITDTLVIDNVGVVYQTRFYDKDDKFINGDTIFIPGVKVLKIENENGFVENRLVHINH